MEKNTKKYANYMEKVVIKLVEKVINDMDICKCEVCRTDILALTLNKLLPKYIVSQKGSNYTKLNYLDPQFEVNVMSTIMEAANVINSNRRHDK